MRFVPIGVAGHVDHGKTTLVKALTGIDTDRLPEEKRRGMSIDIGFAFLDHPHQNLRVELIDIPGHERFIKNAIAGLACVKGMLLVVDPMEGVMPETVKHVRLAKSVGVDHCVVVLTKADKVDRETLEFAKMEVLEFLREEGISTYCLSVVSALTGLGLEDLKTTLCNYAKDISESGLEFFRMVLDSAFHVKGYGTVLRGSCISGKVEEGESLFLEPLGLEVRVKKIQNHGVFVKEGHEGERLAMLVSGIEPSQVERGFMLIKRGQALRSKYLILKVKEKMPKGEGTLFFYMREIPFKRRKISEDLYLINLKEPVVAFVGDMGPIIDSSGALVGSYRVIHPRPILKRKKFINHHLDLLERDLIEYFTLEAGKRGASIGEINALFGKYINPNRIEAVRIDDKFLHKSVVEELRYQLEKIINSRGGFLSLEEVKRSLNLWEGLLKHLIGSLKGYRVVEGYILDEKKANLEDLEIFKQLLEFMEGSIREESELERFKNVLPIAVKRGKIHSLGEHLYISDTLLRQIINKLRSLGDTFEIQDAKQLTGLSRKYLIPLLEYIDRLGYTKREGNIRRFLK